MQTSLRIFKIVINVPSVCKVTFIKTILGESTFKTKHKNAEKHSYLNCFILTWLQIYWIKLKYNQKEYYISNNNLCIVRMFKNIDKNDVIKRFISTTNKKWKCE